MCVAVGAAFGGSRRAAAIEVGGPRRAPGLLHLHACVEARAILAKAYRPL